MKNFKNAFTMIELIFVIVILGILASVAFPKFSAISRDANLAQGKATVASIRAAILNERQRSLIKGTAAYPPFLDDATTASGENLFDGNSTTVSILQYPIVSSTNQGGWMKTSANGATTTYKFYLDTTAGGQETFTYTKSTGLFDCNHNNTNCKEIFDEN